MDITQKINAFVQLGHTIKAFSANQKAALGQMVKTKNEWFTPENLHLALQGLQQYLNKTQLEQWISRYPALQQPPQEQTPRKVGVVMAGDTPAMGFHDLLSVVLSGHVLYAKLPSQDAVLMQELIRLLLEISPELKTQIVVMEQLKGMEAIIATENDNSSRYLKSYFGHLPHIIRQNRSSVAVLAGNESKETLALLGQDLFQYFGLSNRNVSQLLVPQGYQFDPFFEAIFSWGEALLAHSKYANSYEYHRALFLMKKMNMLDNNFLLLAEYDSVSSPAGVLFFEYYDNEAALQQKLADRAAQIQNVVTHHEALDNRVAFGQAATPLLWDYADRVDTMEFLAKL